MDGVNKSNSKFLLMISHIQKYIDQYVYHTIYHL